MKRVLCFGDSNTHGTMPMRSLMDRGRYDEATRWPMAMAAALGPTWRVIEDGLPGRTTVHPDPIEGAHKNGRAMLPASLETHRPLDHVIVMLGTNDLKTRFSVTPFDIAKSLEGLAATIGTSQCGPEGTAPAVLLVAPVPIVETGLLVGMFEGGAAKSRALATEVAAAAEGVHLDVDSHARLGTALAQHLGGEGNAQGT